MAAAPYILARTMKDAHEFARGELGLPYGRYRVVTSSSTVKSVRGADLYLVPGWENRFDRFSMKGAIRWTRMNVIDVATRQAEAPADLRGDLTDEILDLAYAEHAVRSGGGAPGIQSTGADPALVAEFEAFLAKDAPLEFAPISDPLVDLEAAKAPMEETSNGDAMISEGSPVAPKPETQAEAPVEPDKRRRRRCKECGVLVEPDDVERHQAAHDSEA